jgi:hypothetical protein
MSTFHLNLSVAVGVAKAFEARAASFVSNPLFDVYRAVQQIGDRPLHMPLLAFGIDVSFVMEQFMGDVPPTG